MKKTIAIIGAGNMGKAFAQGLVAAKKYNLVVANPAISAQLRADFDDTIILTENNAEAVSGADIVILAVKPQNVSEVVMEIRENVKVGALVLSIAAGISLKTLSALEGVVAVRAMPNLCANIGKSTTVWTGSKAMTDAVRVQVKEILGAVGSEIEVESERDIDNATAISGSGPAYLFYLAECMQHQARKLGFSDEVARKLTNETIYGAAEVLAESIEDAETLRLAVTSKGGTTEAAFASFGKNKLGKVMLKGIQSAAKRAKDIGKTHDK